MNISVLHLSSAHLSADTHAWIAKNISTPTPPHPDPAFEAFFWAWADLSKVEQEDLRDCISHGHWRFFDFVRFTPDGPIEPGLTVYETIPA